MCLLRSVFVVLLCFLLCSCNSDLANNIEDKTVGFNEDITVSPTAVSVNPTKSLSIYYSLDKYTPKKYEPSSCLSGAYILSDKAVGFDIAQFELKTAPHASYKYHMAMGEDFPLSWVLSCYKENKLPFIVLSPQSNSPSTTIYDYTLITNYAKKFGELKLPIILGFYPNPIKNGYNPTLYKSFFEYAKQEFNTYSPNTALAFIMDSSEIYKIEKYLPKRDCIDWLGLDLYFPIENDDINNSYISSLNYFYEKYQSQYPLMLSSFGISSYSTLNHKYYIKNAKEELNGFYSDLEEKYPRIKAVYYMDLDNSEPKGFNLKSYTTDNFSITENDELTLEYKKAIQSPYFLNTFNIAENRQHQAPEKILYSKTALSQGGKYYIPLSLLTACGYKYDGIELKNLDNESYVELEAFVNQNELKYTLGESYIYFYKSNI